MIFLASITQLVRVLGCGSKSCRFKSCYSPYYLLKNLFKALNGYLNIKSNKTDVFKTKLLNCVNLIFRHRKIELY